jgi:hypothetical protein
LTCSTRKTDGGEAGIEHLGACFMAAIVEAHEAVAPQAAAHPFAQEAVKGDRCCILDVTSGSFAQNGSAFMGVSLLKAFAKGTHSSQATMFSSRVI